jgi:hypothetical protein
MGTTVMIDLHRELVFRPRLNDLLLLGSLERTLTPT